MDKLTKRFVIMNMFSVKVSNKCYLLKKKTLNGILIMSLFNHSKVLIPDRSTTAGRRKSFQRCKSVTPEEIDDPINSSPPSANHCDDDIQIVQVHRGEKGV